VPQDDLRHFLVVVLDRRVQQYIAGRIYDARGDPLQEE